MSFITVLIIDDEESNAVVAERQMTSLLESKAFTILRAASAEAGLVMAQKNHPTLILMDIQLPGMDGIEATRILRADPATQNIPIVAVTAASRFSKADLVAEGFTDLIIKPVSVARLIVVLRRLKLW